MGPSVLTFTVLFRSSDVETSIEVERREPADATAYAYGLVPSTESETYKAVFTIFYIIGRSKCNEFGGAARALSSCLTGRRGVAETPSTHT